MTRTFLIATVAALAIISPAQARGERGGKNEERAQKADRGQQHSPRAEARPQAAERRQQRAERPQPRERVRVMQQRSEPRVRVERQAPRIQSRDRAVERRARTFERVRPPRMEGQRVQPQRFERQRLQRVERQRPQRVERQRPQRIERQRLQRVERQRPQRVERQRLQRVERQRPQRVERQRIERQARNQNRIERRAFEQQQRARTVRQRNVERFEDRQVRQQQRVAEQFARSQSRADRRFDRSEIRAQRQQLRQQLQQQPTQRVGERIDLRQRQSSRDWFDAYAAQRLTSFQYASPQYSSDYAYDYDYDDGYLYQVRRDDGVVAALFPILGGAFGVGQTLPIGYDSYNVPYAYQNLYYDTPNYSYRYGDGGIYQVDQNTQMIQAVVALLTGQNFAVGQMLPAGYDVYNVPYAYRDTYFDSDDMWYRYDDGYIYGVDPYSRRIETMIPLSYGGYSVGYPVPSYASYGGYTAYGADPAYSMPYGYDQLYYSQPGYNYHYAGNGIYQVDPVTQIVSALVALVTGTNLSVGQPLPMGYDVYNVPAAYRASYFDTPDSWYRYDDGYIYEIDPASRLIEAQIPVSYDGYLVGQPIPAAYPGYAVPARYEDLYYSAPGYDYRYFDGGIYAIDPNTQVVQSQVALLTGQSFGVGQMLPAGYDVYNLPMSYRSQYHDSPDAWYRYSDGYIYQVDPTTRLIQAVIDAVA